MTKICPANLAPILGSVLGMLAACVPNMVELTLYGPCLDAALSAFGSSCPKLASLNVQIPHVPTQALQGIDHLLPHLTAISVFTLDMTSGTAASSYMDSFFVSIQNCKRLTSCCINLDLDHHPLYCINWSLLPLSLENLHCECELQQHASLGPLIHRVSKLTLQHVPNHHLLDFLAACPRLTHFGVAASFRSRFIISCDPEEHPAELKARIQAMTFSLKYAPLQFCGTTAQLQDTLGWLPRFPKVRNVTIAVIGDMQGRFLGRIGHVFPDLVSLKLRGRQMAASLQSRVMDSKLFMPLADCCFVNSLTISDRFTLTTKGLILLCSRMPRLSSLKIEMSKGVDPTSVSAAVKGSNILDIMPPSIVIHCQDLRRIICNVTKAVTTLAHTPISRPLLLSQLPGLHKLQVAMFPPLEKLKPSMMVGQDMASEHAHFIRDCTALLTVLVPQMERMGLALCTCKTGVVRSMLQCLWNLLFRCCWAYNNWPCTIPRSSELDTLLLHAACNKLLTWLLQLTHSPDIWEAVTFPDVRVHSFVSIVQTPLKCFLTIGLLPPAALVQLTCSLAPDFIPTLCCIISEQLCGLPSLHTCTKECPQASTKHFHSMCKQRISQDFWILSTSQIFYPLLRSIFTCLKALDAPANMCLLPVLTAPAVAHVLKRIVISYPPADPLDTAHLECPDPPTILALNCLLRLVKLPPVSALLSANRTILEDIGLGVSSNASNPSRSDSFTADRQLLHWLCSHKADDPPSQMVQNQVMVLIMRLRPEGETADVAASQEEAWVLTVTASLAGIALQCLSHSLLWMRHMLTERQSLPFSQDTRSSLHSLFPTGQNTTPLQATEKRPEALDPEVKTQTRTLLMKVVQVCLSKAPADRLPIMWCKTHDWLIAMESLMRGEPRPGDEKDFDTLIRNALCAVLNVRDSVNPKSIKTCLSLSATLRKLMWTRLQEPDNHGGALTLPHHCDLMQLGEPLLIVTGALSTLHCYATYKNCFVHRRPAGIISVASNSADAGASTPPLSTSGDITRPCPCAPLIHQLVAVTLVSVVQLQQWSSEFRDDKGRAMHEELQSEVLQVVNFFRTPPVRAMTTSLFNELCSITLEGWLKMGAAWERHAVDHFNGRLLPGCCHLGCTNLAGVSEAALPTLLCGGCRRARYCSAECQRAAWVQGGHRGVCGKYAGVGQDVI